MRLSDELISEELAIMQRVSGLAIDPVGLAVASNIWRASQIFRLRVERDILKDFNLTFSRFSTLFIVWIWGPIEMSSIADSQAVSRATISSGVKKLEEQGLCARLTDIPGEDGRSVQVVLTREGKDLIESVFPLVNKVESEFTSVLSEMEAETLARLLRKLIRGQNSDQKT